MNLVQEQSIAARLSVAEWLAQLRKRAQKTHHVRTTPDAALYADLDQKLADPRIKILSLDIWDTILYRSAHPEQSKLQTAQEFLRLSVDYIEPFYVDLFHLYALRTYCEHQLGGQAKAQGFDHEYEIADVLRMMVAIAAPNMRAADLVLQLVEFEISYEISVIRVNKAFVERVQKIGLPITLVSDFYMNATSLRQILKGAGLQDFGQSLFVSCDAKCNKTSGRLFDHILPKLGHAPHEILHIGDNPYADIASPLAKGMQAFYLRPSQREAEREHLNKQWAMLLWPFPDSDGNLRKIRHFPLLGRRKPLMRRAARLFLPLFDGFCAYLYAQALKGNHTKIYFFAREGYFLKALFDKWQKTAEKKIETTVLPVSRMATFLPSMHDISIENMMRQWSQYQSGLTISSILTSLQSSHAEFADILSLHGLSDPIEPIYRAWLHPKIRALFADDAFKTRLQAKADQQRTYLNKILQDEGFVEGADHMIVDIGWRGSIQDNIAHAFPTYKTSGFYLGLYEFYNVQPKNTKKLAFLLDANGADVRDRRSLISSSRPLEMLCNGTGGSVLHYTKKDGVTKQIIVGEDSVFDRYVAFFQDELLNNIQMSAYDDIAILNKREYARQIVDVIMHYPPAIIAKADGELHHNETFGVGRIIYNRNIPFYRWPMALLSKKAFGKIQQKVINSNWPEGFLKRHLWGIPLLVARKMRPLPR